MPNFNGLKVSDIFGLSEPLAKLVETVSCGVGKLYEPTHIRRLAKAKAEEIKIISDAVTDNLNLPMSYQNGKVCIDTINANELVQRAQNRFLFQQMKKQQNIEAVVANAYIELDKTTRVSAVPVDEDWISSFFDFVANISNSQMQIIWGKLLAGEVTQPGSFSIRTLDTLRKLTQREAEMFTEILPFVMRCAGDSSHSFYDYFLLADSDEEKRLQKICGYSFPQIVTLMEAGLVSANSGLAVGENARPGTSIRFEGQTHIIEITNTDEHSILVEHEAYLLTECGKELASIAADSIKSPPPYDFFEACARAITDSNWMLSKEDSNHLTWRIMPVC